MITPITTFAIPSEFPAKLRVFLGCECCKCGASYGALRIVTTSTTNAVRRPGPRPLPRPAQRDQLGGALGPSLVQGWGYSRAADSANLSSSGTLTTIGSGFERVTTQTVGRSVEALIS
jgi:hypothetical protein